MASKTTRNKTTTVDGEYKVVPEAGESDQQGGATEVTQAPNAEGESSEQAEQIGELVPPEASAPVEVIEHASAPDAPVELGTSPEAPLVPEPPAETALPAGIVDDSIEQKPLDPPMPASVLAMQAEAEAASSSTSAEEPLPEISAIDQASMDAAAETALPAGIVHASPTAAPIDDEVRDWPQTGHITNETPFPLIEPESGVSLMPFVKTPITVPNEDAARRLVGALVTLARTKGIDEEKLKFSAS